METSVYFLNRKTGKIQILGKIDCVDDLDGLDQLGALGNPVILPHPEFPTVKISWAGTLGVGSTAPEETVLTSLNLSATQINRANRIGEGNLGLGIYRAIWKASRDGLPAKKFEDTSPRRLVQARLTETDRHLARELGRGKIAEGIRAALDG